MTSVPAIVDSAKMTGSLRSQASCDAAATNIAAVQKSRMASPRFLDMPFTACCTGARNINTNHISLQLRLDTIL